MNRPAHRRNKLKASVRMRRGIASEALERRTLLAGRTAVYLVSGLGGAAFPDGVSAKLNQLEARVGDSNKFRVHYSNWNSFEIGPNSDPGAFDPTKFDIDTAGTPNTDIQFRNDLAADIEKNGYDDQDTIVLIGHSLGGAAVLHAAERNIDINIDLLVLFDPVSSTARGLRSQILTDEIPSNVTYFYNRWQNNTPFPVDYSIPGVFLNDHSTGNLQADYGFASQSSANTLRQSDNSVRRVPADFVDSLFGLVELDPGDPGEFPFGAQGLGRAPRLPSVYSTSTHHDNLPLDNRLNFEISTILDGIIPSPPVAVASAVSIGRDFQEGDLINLTSAGTYDPNPNDTLSYSWSQIGGRKVSLSDSSSPTLQFLASDDTFLDDSTLRFRLTVTDNTGLTSTADVAVTIRNVAPVLAPINGPDTFVRGFIVPLAVPYNDPGTADALSASWNFGDGTITPFASLRGATGVASSPDHSYRNTGTYSVQVNVRDDDATVEARKNVTIEIAGIITDPDDPTKKALAVGGGTSDDSIVVEPTSTPGQVLVTVSNSIDGFYQRVFDLNPSSRVLIGGGEGRDTIEVRSDLGRRVDIEGGPDDDSVVVTGVASDSGTYIPSGTMFGDGRITLNASPINFLGVEAAIVGGIGDFRLITPNSPDSVTIGLDPDAANRNRITGASDDVAFTPLSFANVTSFVLDTGTNDGASADDLVVLGDGGLIAAGLQNFTVATGLGADTFAVTSSLSLPVAGGRFGFDAGGPSGPDGDRLLITGTGSNDGGYSPDPTTSRAGSITEDGSALNFTDLEDAFVSSMTSFRVATPRTSDHLRIDAPSVAVNRVSGSVGLAGIARLTFTAIANVTIDARNQQADSSLGDDVTIDNPGAAALVALGLQNFTVLTGPGNDTLTINAADFRLPVAGGQFLFDSGTGNYPDSTPASNLRGLISLDRIVVNADVNSLLTDVGIPAADETPPEGRLSFAGAGSEPAVAGSLGIIRLISVESARLIGGGSANRLDASGFSGTVELDGMGGNDTLIGGSGDTILDGGDGNDELFAGTDRFLNPGLGSQANVLLGGGGASTLLGGAGNDIFHADLGSSATLVGGDGVDTFLITNPAVGVNAPVAGITIDGGGQAGDTLNLIGGGGSTYNQTYVAGPLAGEGEIVTTNNHNPTGLTIAQFVQFRGLATINDSINANRLSLLAASPAAPIAGASGADLAAGVIRLTVGGNLFPVINFSNKTGVSVQLADGQTVSPPPLIASPEPVIEPLPGPVLTIDATTPAGPPATVIPPASAPVAVAVAVATPRLTLPAGPILVASRATTTPAATVELATHRSLAAIRAARRVQVQAQAKARIQAKKQAHVQAREHAKSHLATPHPKGPHAVRAGAVATRAKTQRRLAVAHR